MSEIVSSLTKALGEDAVVVSSDISARYAADVSGENPRKPIAVVMPRSTDDVATALKLCSAALQGVVVQGGMTGLSGGATPQDDELSLSLERLNGIDSIDADAMTMTVRAGTPLQTIQEAAEAAGFLFPLDLGARGSCHIGGLIATNAGGNQVIRFGMTRNLVLGLEAVLADGTIVSSMNRMLKNNAGYDLKQLFIGTEGTLGIVTRAVLRLYPRLPSKCTALCAFQSFDNVVAVLRDIQQAAGGSLSAFEVMWSSYYDYVLDHIETLSSPFAENYPLYALIETEGTDSASDSDRFETVLGTALETGLIVDAAIAQSEKDIERFWAIRDGVGEITAPLTPYASIDVSLGIADMPAFVDRVDTLLKGRYDPITNLVFGHVGDNNLHLFITTGREEDLDDVLESVYTITGEYEGSISAEHGVGALKRDFLHYSRSDAEIQLMRTLKRALDPKGILNVGRVI